MDGPRTGAQRTWPGLQVGYDVDTKNNVGDTITTRCSWDNTTDSVATFGEKPSGEMRHEFIAYYPRVNIQIFSGVTPAALSSRKVVE